MCCSISYRPNPTNSNQTMVTAYGISAPSPVSGYNIIIGGYSTGIKSNSLTHSPLVTTDRTGTVSVEVTNLD